MQQIYRKNKLIWYVLDLYVINKEDKGEVWINKVSVYILRFIIF